MYIVVSFLLYQVVTKKTDHTWTIIFQVTFCFQEHVNFDSDLGDNMFVSYIMEWTSYTMRVFVVNDASVLDHYELGC